MPLADFEVKAVKETFLGFTVHVHHKGQNSIDEMKRANDLGDARDAMMRSTMDLAQQRFATAEPMIRSLIQNKGMLPEQEAALRSQAMAMTGSTEKDIVGQLNSSLVARGITGGGNAGSGDIARNFGGLESGLAGMRANLEQGIQLQKTQGLQGALGMELGAGSTLLGGAMGFGGQGVSALGSGVTAANNADQASTALWGSLIGGLAGLGGDAMKSFCVAAGTLVRNSSGEDIRVEHIKPGNILLGVDAPNTVLSNEQHEQACVEVITEGGRLVCSLAHTLLRPKGGYVRAVDAPGTVVKTEDGESEVLSVSPVGMREVHMLALDGSHTFLSGNLWSEE